MTRRPASLRRLGNRSLVTLGSVSMRWVYPSRSSVVIMESLPDESVFQPHAPENPGACVSFALTKLRTQRSQDDSISLRSAGGVLAARAFTPSGVRWPVFRGQVLKRTPAEVAQWIEHQAVNLTVTGSNPVTHQRFDCKVKAPGRESVHHEAGGQSIATPNQPQERSRQWIRQRIHAVVPAATR